MTVSDLQFQYSDTSENQLNSQCLATLYWDKISVYVKENKLQRNPLSSLHACIKRNQVQQTLPIENVSQIRVITNGISPLFSNGHKKIINEGNYCCLNTWMYFVCSCVKVNFCYYVKNIYT